MSEANRSFLSSLPVRLGGTVAAIAIIAVLMIKPSEKNGDEDDNQGKNNIVVVPEDSRCEQELERIISVLEPGRRSVQTPSKDAAAELTTWFKNCGVEEDNPISTDEDVLTKFLDEQSLVMAQLERFRPADVDHLRFCLLARQMHQRIAKSANSDAEQVLALFQFMCQYVRLVPAETASQFSMPTTPYESILLGYASAEGRAWMFSSMLEQLRLDTVRIAPAADEKSDQWLIGVNVPKVGVLLFDPRLGLPIPGGDDDKSRPFPTSVATLADVRNDDSLLRQLDVEGEPYPLTSNDLQQLKVQFIGSPILRSPRMGKLQWVFPTDADVYNGLGSNQLREPGALDRLIAIGRESKFWDAEQITNWEYPTTELIQLDALREVESSPYHELMRVMAGPFLSVFDESSGQVIEQQVSNPLHEVRLLMLTNHHAEALKYMGTIMSSAMKDPTAGNSDALILVQLWMGISQMETGYFTAAIKTLTRYTQTISTPQVEAILKDVLDQSASDWKAETFLATGNYTQAIETLREKPSTSSKARDLYLTKRWSPLISSQASANK